MCSIRHYLELLIKNTFLDDERPKVCKLNQISFFKSFFKLLRYTTCLTLESFKF